ncbi:MAG TPA: CheR family methyltransferase [Polyangiaceae bacterium]
MNATSELTELEIDLFLEAFFRRYRHDFRRYARPTMRRRLQLALQHFECQSLSLLQHLVLRDAATAAEMLGYLTVQVSNLFRDPGYYLALRQQVLPLLATYPSLKVWVAGCGAGEELYSLAILLHEEDLLRRTLLYATDVNAEALRRAELGVYAIDRARTFSENYRSAGGKASLSDYYTSAYDGIVFDRQLRENVVFSDHSLATDSVFAEVQLVSCRNVLIYFDAELKNRAIGLFHDSLVRKGFLALGSRENLRGTSRADDFIQIDRPNRIYRKR